jgi:hypothetical protein
MEVVMVPFNDYRPQTSLLTWLERAEHYRKVIGLLLSLV